MANLYSLELEKTFLSGTVLHPSTRCETSHVTPADLSTTNRVILSAIDACLVSGTPFSTFLLVDRLNSLGIKIADSIEPGLYIKALEGLAVGEKAVIGIAKQLKTVSIRRKLYETGQRITKAMEKGEAKKAAELLAEATTIFNEQVNLLGGTDDDEPKDLYRTMDAFLDAESSFDTRSIPTPYPLYNDMYGWMDPGQIYCVAARAKTGKSTFVMSLLHQLAKADGEKREFRALLLDTELSIEEVQSRLLSSMTGIQEFYIRRKLYRKDPAMRAKVDAARKELAPLWDHVDHIFVGGKSTEEQVSILTRWTHKHVTRGGKRGLAVLDYFKIDGNEFDSKSPRDITLGKKVNSFKQAAKHLRIPIWALVQAGRENEDSKAGGKIENGSVVAGSDMISQFCSTMMILQKLTPDERAFFRQDGPGGATHSLKSIYQRQLGPNERQNEGYVVHYSAPGPHNKDVLKRVENYLFYSFRNFHCTEVGTLKDIVAKLKSTAPGVQPPRPPDGDGDRQLL